MPATFSELNKVFYNLINNALGLIGVAAIVMIIVSGFKFISAGPDKEAANKAKGTITFAIIGLIIAISAWMIINIFGQLLGITGLDTFSICFPGQTC